MGYKVDLNALLEQGDILRGVSVITKFPNQEGDIIERGERTVVVLSHGCEIDKPIDYTKRTDTVLIACVFAVSNMPKSEAGHLKKDRIWSACYLPQEEPLEEDFYIDWRTIQPINKQVLLDKRKNSKQYICTLEGEILDKACDLLWDFFFRPRPSPLS